MNSNYETMIEIKNRFQSMIKNPKLEYTYIAPKEKKLHQKFLLLVEKQPTLTGSYSEILNNPDKIRILLEKNFLTNVELDIYYRTDDIYSDTVIESSLKDFIQRNGINFLF